MQLGAVLVCGVVVELWHLFDVFGFLWMREFGWQMVTAAKAQKWAQVLRLIVEGAGLNELDDKKVCESRQQ